MSMYNRPAAAWRAGAPGPQFIMPDASPLVSIIVPTRDRCALLADTIDSVRRQTYENIELLVVDDQSTDATAEMLARISRDDPRVKLLSLDAPRTGAPAARNYGLSQSRGSLIIFLDSDDLLAPNSLARRVEVMQSHPHLDFAVFPAQVFLEQIDDTKLLFNADTGED